MPRNAVSPGRPRCPFALGPRAPVQSTPGTSRALPVRCRGHVAPSPWSLDRQGPPGDFTVEAYSPRGADHRLAGHLRTRGRPPRQVRRRARVTAGAGEAPEGPPASSALRPRVGVMAVVIATDIEVGDWLELGGRLREIEAVQETGFSGPNGWVHAVLMQLQGWTTVQVPASALTIKVRARSGPSSAARARGGVDGGAFAWR